MNKTIYYISIIAVLLFASCDDLFDSEGGETPYKPSTDEVVTALKTALSIGTDSAVSRLSAVDGYYGDALIKILLPPEAQTIKDNVSSISGNLNGLTSLAAQPLIDIINGKFEKLTENINRAAEYAAVEGGGIFANAISNMSISEGWDILNGKVPGSTKSSSDFDSTAATSFLKMRTLPDLTTAFATPMNSALDQNFVGDFSANELWGDITGNYNELVELVQPLGMNYNSVNTNLGEFVVGKALDGFFLKIGNEEKKIRNNPFDWAVQIIQDVFGYIKDQFENSNSK